MYKKGTLLRVLTILGLSCAWTGQSQAGLVIGNASIDITGFSGNGLYSVPTLTLANGDTLDLTVTFLNNKALQISDPSESFVPWLYAGDNNSSFSISNISLEFLGFQGAGGAANTYNLAAATGGAAHLGPTFTSFLTAGQSVTFTGYRLIYDINTIAVSPHDYSYVWLQAKHVSVVDAPAPAAVPEPSGLVLLGLGITGLCGFRRRRKRGLAA